MAPRIILLGIDHRFQKDDATGNFRTMLLTVLSGSQVDLICEEATPDVSTVARQTAGELGKPWVGVDMSTEERIRAGIQDELSKPRWYPFCKDGVWVARSFYYPHAYGIREEYWISRVLRPGIESYLVICGAMHFDPLAGKFRQKGCVVEGINVCAQEWYVNRFGPLHIFEENGERWSEQRLDVEP